MEVTLVLPEAMVERLERQADKLNISLDDMAWKLLNDALVIESAVTTPADNDDESDLPSLEEVVARIKATPPNPAAVVPATKTIEEVVAYWEANPPDESDIE